MNALEMKNVCKKYDSFALKNINLTLPRGTVVGLIGENGAGKTTLIKLLLNLVHKDSGSIKVLGCDDIANNRSVYEKIGNMWGDDYLPSELNLIKIENIMKSIFPNWDSVKFFRLTDRFHLDKNQKFGEFSKGMLVKATIAITLSHQTELLILDEPTSGLDPIIREEILDMLLDYLQDENHSILISSHITSDIEKIADFIAFLKNGEIVLFEAKDKLIYEYGLIKCRSVEASAIDKEDYICSNHSENGSSFLVSDKNMARDKYKNFIVDDVNLEQILIILNKGR